MGRDLIISILLIIAGIVLALVLFGAGVLWRSTLKRGELGSERQQGISADNCEVNCRLQGDLTDWPNSERTFMLTALSGNLSIVKLLLARRGSLERDPLKNSDEFLNWIEECGRYPEQV